MRLTEKQRKKILKDALLNIYRQLRHIADEDLTCAEARIKLITKDAFNTVEDADVEDILDKLYPRRAS
jgi:hypothetical protein